mmetsp:Transcript_30938/g.69626  ORF Transcript_30938/g.69626 Transcript_30938/m.69626 type:complete len:98 (+) Transcript_30938:1-294(+)
MSTARAAEPQVITVTLAKREGAQRFGFTNVPSKGTGGLFIMKIAQGGLLEEYNLGAAEAAKVRAGARIHSVNGIQDVEEMRAALREASKVEMVVECP